MPQIRGGPVAQDRSNKVMGRYAAAAAALGARLGLPVLELHSLLQREAGWGPRLLADGLHFTPEGQAVVGRLMIELINRTYPELRCGRAGGHAAVLGSQQLLRECVQLGGRV